ncbi:MAG: hypothetical protein A2937_01525 [Candidatus Yonathbacteria bacterium RIFCSPLOWO2_01_FULL_47_33b]|uniref:Uncharacterized protein n=1 Tax=Candidatus Yonathbacteria bacterium RIFCSPLOWO2_01_FULL_47_33b TaxID=1802727 RepID=A0A1G2SJ10_9BACT|nr:MAG: hypothetical protein A2937_01525 [Candidatus Yonathbacteria bacterium RIFCSPLOWO2_01_FULL_47_33b]
MKAIGSFMRELSASSGKFHPHLHYDESMGCLQVLLRNCDIREVEVSRSFDVLKNNHPQNKKGNIAGFILWGARGMLYDQGYTKSSISLEHLIKRFERHNNLPHNTSVFGRYDEYVLRIARKHQFVWHISE